MRFRISRASFSASPTICSGRSPPREERRPDASHDAALIEGVKATQRMLEALLNREIARAPENGCNGTPFFAMGAIMNKFKAGPSEGVFDSSAVKLFEAFEKADAHVNRSDSADVPDTDREDLARRIISEARTGQTQLDFLWRSAVANKMLIEQKTDPIPEKREEIPSELHQDKPDPPYEPVKIPPAGPHATPSTRQRRRSLDQARFRPGRPVVTWIQGPARLMSPRIVRLRTDCRCRTRRRSPKPGPGKRRDRGLA
jgi:hypothetical protein